MSFEIGQSVIWLSRLLGTYGVDFIDKQVVTMTEVQVVRIAPKRVLVQLVSATDERRVWVNPAQLRRTDDPAVVAGFEKRKTWATSQGDDEDRKPEQKVTAIALV